MRVLLRDLIRQRAIALSIYCLASLAAVVWWVAEGMEEAAGIRPILAAGAMGVLFSIAHSNVRHMERAVWYLPISKRDNFRARWIFATLIAPLAGVPGLVLPAFVERTAPATEAALLSVLYTFAYAGFGCALVALATRPIRAAAPWRQLDATAAALADVALPMGLLVPGLTQQFHLATLPMRVSDMSPLFVAGLLVAIASGVAAYFHVPPPIGRTARAYAPGAEPGLRAKPTTVERHTAAAPRRTPAFSGLPLLLLHEYRWALLLATAFTLFAIAFVAAATKTTPFQWLDTLTTVVRSVDEPVPRTSDSQPALQMLIALGIFAAALGNRLSLRLRHLRVLPLSTHQIVLLLVLFPAAVWLTAWIALLLLHYALIGSAPQSLHLAHLAAWIGATAVVRAVRLRFSNSTATILFAGMLLGVGYLLVVSSTSAFIVAGFGAASIAGAVAVNYAALRHNAIYRRREVVLGVMPIADTAR